jgi:hypothetical protein
VWKRRAAEYNERNERLWAPFDARVEAILEKRLVFRPQAGRRRGKPMKGELSERTKIFSSAGYDDRTGAATDRDQDKATRFVGVVPTRGRWLAEVLCPDNVVRTVGRYDSEPAAALAFDQALRFLYPIRVTEAVANLPFKETLRALRTNLPSIEIFKNNWATIERLANQEAAPVAAPATVAHAPAPATATHDGAYGAYGTYSSSSSSSSTF